MDDGLDDAQQPRCRECGTVLVNLRRGYHCRGCDLVFLDGIPSRARPGDTA